MIWDPISFHIELTTACSASCPFCPRTINSWKITPQDLRLQDIKKFFTLDVLTSLKYVTICGSFGDPIYAIDFLKIIEYFSENNVYVCISTNGYNTRENFWDALWRMKNVRIIFGIDGITQKTHGAYRIWTDLKVVLKNAKTFIDAWGKAEWQFLVFKTNEHQVELAKQVAKRLGFHDFYVRTSRNYSEKLPKPIYVFEKEWKVAPKGNVVCDFAKKKQWYLSSSGQILPCCYLWTSEYENEEFLDAKMNIKNSSFQEVQKHATWLKDIWNIINLKWNNVCKKHCSTDGSTKRKSLVSGEYF